MQYPEVQRAHCGAHLRHFSPSINRAEVLFHSVKDNRFLQVEVEVPLRQFQSWKHSFPSF